MAFGGDGQEKTEDATPRRKQKARQQGSVAKSIDLNSAAAVLALMVILPGVGGALFQAFMTSFKTGMNEMPSDVSLASLTSYISRTAQGPVIAFSGLLFGLLGVGLVANFAQVGFFLSGEALQPKFERLNPMSGFKRIFSRNALMEGFKAAIKTGLFGYLAWGGLEAHRDALILTAWQDPGTAFMTTADCLKTIGVRVGAAWLVLAALDYLYQRKSMDKQLRMSKDEVKQEFKETESSPEMKMAQARARRRLKKGRMMDAVREASVIVTNPTHYAVAIKYEPGEMHAPQVVAKGVDIMAMRIREEAKKAGVPIVPSPPLARQLYKKCDIGDYVPRELFQAVAEVLAFVYRTLKDMR